MPGRGFSAEKRIRPPPPRQKTVALQRFFSFYGTFSSRFKPHKLPHFHAVFQENDVKNDVKKSPSPELLHSGEGDSILLGMSRVSHRFRLVSLRIIASLFIICTSLQYSFFKMVFCCSVGCVDRLIPPLSGRTRMPPLAIKSTSASFPLISLPSSGYASQMLSWSSVLYPPVPPHLRSEKSSLVPLGVIHPVSFHLNVLPKMFTALSAMVCVLTFRRYSVPGSYTCR